MNNEEHITRSQKKARKELIDRVRAALADPNTRYLLRWVLERAGMFDQAFTGNSQTFFNEGKREVGLEVVALLNEVDPYEFVRLMKEGADEVVQKRNQARGVSDED